VYLSESVFVNICARVIVSMRFGVVRSRVVKIAYVKQHGSV
jgi:hypothetical protein